MEMKEIHNNNLYKILSVTLSVGEEMPVHEATSDAFIILRKGKGKISFDDRQVELSAGETLLIKAHERHQLEVLEDFNSCIVLENAAQINFL